ncbi:MAG: hypothetical protein ACRCT2_03880 [Plesiomonas shigelloides]
MQFLYRGVSEDLYEELNRKLKPKNVNEKFESFVHAGDPHAVCGSGVECGESNLNAVISHQWEQAGLPTSGVSTSPFIERAKFYALNGDTIAKGYVYTLSIEKLLAHGVTIFKVNDMVPGPAIPIDDEHILVAKDFGCIPECAIISIEEVNRVVS